MFEFAISQHKRRPLGRRFIASCAVSCLAHVAGVWLLIQYPGLLRPGSHIWFRFPTLIARNRSPLDEHWRKVAFVGNSSRLQTPSADTLKKYLYDWNRESSPKGSPPIRVKGGDDAIASKGNTTENVPPVQPALGAQEPKPVPNTGGSAPAPPPVATGEGGVKTSETPTTDLPVQFPANTSTSDKKSTLYLPAPTTAEPKPTPKKVGEVAEKTSQGPPSNQSALSASDKQKGLNPAQLPDKPKTFEDEKAAIRTEGSGLFDTKGFPLDTYASIIIARIKGNWSIPSNLRNSQGRSTLIFFIEKDGQISGLRVVNPSGSDSLDLAALNSVLGSNPFPPLPRGFPGGHIGAKFVFSYNERQ